MQARILILYLSLVFLMIASILMVVLLDAFKQIFTDRHIGIDIAIPLWILLWTPLSIYITVRTLHRSLSRILEAPVLPSLKSGTDLDCYRASGPLEEYIILLGFGHTWLMFSRLLYTILNASNSIEGVVAQVPLLFAFQRHSSMTISSLFTIIIFGTGLELSGIHQTHWGPFRHLYLLASLLVVTIPLRTVVAVSRWAVALSEGRVGILERFEEEQVESVPASSIPSDTVSEAEEDGLVDEQV